MPPLGVSCKPLLGAEMPACGGYRRTSGCSRAFRGGGFLAFARFYLCRRPAPLNWRKRREGLEHRHPVQTAVAGPLVDPLESDYSALAEGLYQRANHGKIPPDRRKRHNHPGTQHLPPSITVPFDGDARQLRWGCLFFVVAW